MDAASSVQESRQSLRSSRFQCPECSQTFGRVEHLARHSRSHMKERFLKCSYCRKEFYRVDALKRHEKVHKEPKRSVLGRGARACLSCATARRKCSGDVPCAGCQQRSTECKYPNAAPESRASSSHMLLSANMPSPHGDESTPCATDHPMEDSHQSPMSWSNASGSPAGGEPNQLNGPSSQCTAIQQVEVSQAFAPQYHNSFLSPRLQMQALASPEVGESELGNSFQRQPLTAHSGQHMNGIVAPVSLSEDNSFNPSDHNASADHNSSTNASAPWYQSNFPSINWLPDDWTPDFQMDNGNVAEAFERDQALMFGNILAPSPVGYPNARGSSGPGHPIEQHISQSGESPQSSVRIMDEYQISSPGSQSTNSAGQFYIDGDGARMPRIRRAPYQITEPYLQPQRIESRESHPTFEFPVMNEIVEDLNTLSPRDSIPVSTYNEILRAFNFTCVMSDHYPKFQSDSFPSMRTLEQFVRLYKHHFQPILPFIHPSSFDVASTHWLLLLAMAVIGSRYTTSERAETLTVAMHEFLNRSVQTMMQTGHILKPDNLVLIQAKLLSCVGIIYSGDDGLAVIAKDYHHALAEFCRTEWLDVGSEENRTVVSDSDHIDRDWKIWHQAEARRRTGYCIWLLDCMWSFHFQIRPLLSLADAKVPIPCQEVLWEAESALDWQQLHACATPSTSLYATMQIAYIEKRIQSSTGEFSRILCLHALFRRTWEVETYFKQPLTLWTPTAEKQNVDIIEDAMPIWLPGIQTYSKWRNSACDCLDILHWHANSVIGAASGIEHPTVLHLHLARVILLTPFREIISLTSLLTLSEPTAKDKISISKLVKFMQRWVLEDQYKARLAMIHGGVLLWHVRRYSTDAFYEPSSIFLGTLALWAYGTFAPHTPPPKASPAANANSNTQSQETVEDLDDETSLFPTAMQLDRPADDELVQLFVKRGASMRANITGVGNLCSAKGPLRILGEGRNLLAGMKVWGEGKRCMERLGSLIEILKHRDGSG